MLFTPKLIATNDNDENFILNSPGLLGQSIHVIPRAQCAFRRYRLKGSGKPAVEAILLRAMNEARSGHDKFKIIKDPDNKTATVWSYNSKNISKIRSLPETLCVKPVTSGLRLVNCLSGVEGQIWDEGVLVASRWWHNDPSAAEWASFIRVAPFDFVSDIPAKPAVEKVNYRENFPIFSFDKQNFEDIITPSRVGMFASIIALFSIGLMSTKYFHYAAQLSQIEVQKTEVSEQANIILSKRRRALTHIAAIQKFKDVEPRQSLMGALGALAEVLKGQDVTLRELSVKDNEIEIRMEGNSSMRVPELVAQLEQTSFLKDVSVTNDRQNSFLIKAQLNNNAGNDGISTGSAQ